MRDNIGSQISHSSRREVIRIDRHAAGENEQVCALLKISFGRGLDRQPHRVIRIRVGQKDGPDIHTLQQLLHTAGMILIVVGQNQRIQ